MRNVFLFLFLLLSSCLLAQPLSVSKTEYALTIRRATGPIVSLDLTYNGIRLPAPYCQSALLLISPKVDLSFTRSVFLTAYAQYNNQINNVNTNIRFQWRYKPVSDLFVVYTDNYFAYETPRR